MIGGRFFRELRRFDWLRLLATFTLFLFGLAAIYSVELSRESMEFALLKQHALIFFVATLLTPPLYMSGDLTSSTSSNMLM